MRRMIRRRKRLTALSLILAGATFIVTLAGWKWFEPTAQAATFSVTNTNNSGAGSLSQAIADTNSTAGADTISFNIPGSDPNCNPTTHVCTITPTSQLPAITDQVVIDGYTQPGASANTQANSDDAVLLIEISGNILGNNGDGLVIQTGGSGSTVRGLAIDGAGINSGWNAGISISSNSNVVEGCFLGTDPTGLIAHGNTHGVLFEFGANASSNRIGGTTLAARNLISGNGNGIFIRGSNPGNLVQGNFIGTNATGTAALANSTAVEVRGSDNLIGGTTAAARNIIAGSGNTTGISVNTDVATPTGNRIQGNFIGTGVNGTTPLGFSNAISLSSGATQIGGLTATPGTPPGNVIAGSSTGIFVNGSNNTIQGNLIGTDVTGTNALGNSLTGINVQGSSNVIGGTDVMARNVISANGRGISLGTNNAAVQNNLVQGNFIGTDITGTQLLGNGDDGVFVTDSTNNIIGGVVASAGAPPGNLIAGNGGRGVGVISITRLAVLGNSIFSNGGLGIDLIRDGVTPNDACDPDAGPNNRQNFPLLTSVNSSISDTTIQGTLDSLANNTFRIEFFANDACDPSGNGEGQTFIGFTNVTTDGSCSASFNVTLPTPVPDGQLVTATATLLDVSTNPVETSEFSAWFPVGGPASLQFSSPNYNVNENGGSATINVTRTGTTGGAVTVNYATSNDTATAGSDYTATSGTLTFGPGETSKTFFVPIVTDALVEGNETVNLTLSSSSCGAVLGAQTTAVLTIVDSAPTAAPGTISGTITNGAGAPVSGVVINLSGSQSRKTITDANGNYHFDDVETNGFYIVTPARANYTFTPAQRAFSQLGQHTEAAFDASADAGTLNPLDTTEYFVRQQYLDFLNREPDESGFNFWVNNIESCGANAQCREAKGIDTSAAFFLSIEFQQTGYLVYRMYQSAYGDTPGSPAPLRLSEFRPDSAEISSGVVVLKPGWEGVLENNKQAFAAEFVQRARFTAAYPGTMTPSEFVDKLFTNAGITPSDSDRLAAIGEFGSATASSDAAARGRTLRRVAENSMLAEQEFNPAFVLMQYFGYLRRDPNSGPDADFDGYNFWLDKLNTFGGNFQNAEMVRAFLVSTEYRGRFPR